MISEENMPAELPKLTRLDVISIQVLKTLMESNHYKNHNFSYEFDQQKLAEKAFGIANALERNLND